MRFVLTLLAAVGLASISVADDPPQKFRQVSVPMLNAMKVINKSSGVLTDKKGDSGFWTAETPAGMEELFPVERKDGKFILPARPDVDFDAGEVLVVLILKLKDDADVTVTSCMWTDSGSACDVRYKLGPKREGVSLEIGGKKIKPDHVTKSIGIVTHRPREAPIIVASEKKE